MEQDRPAAKEDTNHEPADTNEQAEKRLYTPADFSFAFNTADYLKDFYKDKVEEPAMQLVIWYLPSVLTRLDEVDSALDFGAGPTVHVPMILRHKARHIYLSDYLPQNREELVAWVRGRSTFCWDPVAKMIADREGVFTGQEWRSIEADARKKVRGVLHCDMHKECVVPRTGSGDAARFDLVLTFFCVEYACLTEEAYTRALCNIVGAVKPGGYLVMGGVLEEEWCAFGGRRFACLFLTESLVLNSLRHAGIDVDNSRTFHLMMNNGVFLVCGQRLPSAAETRG